jgi:tellurite resistance protein TerC
MTAQFWLWTGFAIFVLGMLSLDLGVFHRKAHTISFKEAFTWTWVWVSLAALFGLGVWHFEGQRKAVEFYTGYLIELSLSADNVFVFVLIFTYFAVPQKYQHKVLFWGVLGALVMRVLMIAIGASLIQKFGWLLYPFGVFLIFTGIKMVFSKEKQLHPEQNPLVRWVTRRVPVTADYREDRFFVRNDGKRSATPLFVVLLCVEVSDLVFAVDSIPAIFAVTLDPFIIYTSNVFAIMGLRSLYFVLAKIVDKFYYLRTGLGVVLGFVGVKMLLAHTDHEIDTPVALCVVGGVLVLALAASLLRAWFRTRQVPPAQK